MPTDKKLKLRFHGRVIDHLGIDMYQSPVAAVAEMVSNAWDADATSVRITLPTTVGPAGVFEITDDGQGMTLEECENRFLAVGYDTRKGDAKATSGNGRPLMGRKGIGKFAGFGIADMVEIETISGETGERTKFHLDIRVLRGTGEYVATDATDIVVDEYDPPDDSRRAQKGTTIRLRSLKMAQRPSKSQFSRSMARRFLLLQRADDFTVTVDGDEISAIEDAERIEFDFPTAYRDEEKPATLTIDEGWGQEQLADGNTIRWRIVFYKETIDEEDLAGVSVFAHGKLAQVPFLFNLTGGLGGQHGAAYMSGQVEAGFVDEQSRDLIATERQRLNWQAPETQALLQWGQARVKELLGIWRDRRGEEKVKALEKKLAPFSARLEKLPKHEREIVKRALRNIAKIPTISQAQFGELAGSVLTAWEGGRLRDLTAELAKANDLDEAALLDVMVEARVLTALHTAEAVKAQLSLIVGLEERIKRRELENAVRDYIADNPWLVRPEWSTFQVERAVGHLIEAAAKDSGLDKDPGFVGRVDLTLSAGEQLLVVEFMRPGLKVDWDHLSRFERYVLALRTRVRATTGGPFRRVSGMLVADELDDDPTVIEKLVELATNDMHALSWPDLLSKAAAQWRDYFDLLVERAPEDDRLTALAEELLDALPDGGEDVEASEAPA